MAKSSPTCGMSAAPASSARAPGKSDSTISPPATAALPPQDSAGRCARDQPKASKTATPEHRSQLATDLSSRCFRSTGTATARTSPRSSACATAPPTQPLDHCPAMCSQSHATALPSTHSPPRRQQQRWSQPAAANSRVRSKRSHYRRSPNGNLSPYRRSRNSSKPEPPELRRSTHACLQPIRERLQRKLLRHVQRQAQARVGDQPNAPLQRDRLTALGILLKLSQTVDRVHELAGAFAYAQHVPQPQLSDAQRKIERLCAHTALAAAPRVCAFSFVAFALLAGHHLQVALH